MSYAEGCGVRPDPKNLDRKDPEIHAARRGQIGQGNFSLRIPEARTHGSAVKTAVAGAADESLFVVHFFAGSE